MSLMNFVMSDSTEAAETYNDEEFALAQLGAMLIFCPLDGVTQSNRRQSELERACRYC